MKNLNRFPLATIVLRAQESSIVLRKAALVCASASYPEICAEAARQREALSYVDRVAFHLSAYKPDRFAATYDREVADEYLKLALLVGGAQD